MKALTIRQPHANRIFYQCKDIENRTWCRNISGLVAIHAGAQLESDDLKPKDSRVQMVLGAIIGVVDVVDCVEEHKSKWFNGPYGFVLANPRLLPKPIPFKGKLGFWDVPSKIEREIRKQLKVK
jgi:hypothetical protein